MRFFKPPAELILQWDEERDARLALRKRVDVEYAHHGLSPVGDDVLVFDVMAQLLAWLEEKDDES